MLQTDSPTIRPSDRAERKSGNGECDGHTARYAGARAIEFGAAAKDAAGGGRCGAGGQSGRLQNNHAQASEVKHRSFAEVLLLKKQQLGSILENLGSGGNEVNIGAASILKFRSDCLTLSTAAFAERVACLV